MKTNKFENKCTRRDKIIRKMTDFKTKLRKFNIMSHALQSPFLQKKKKKSYKQIIQCFICWENSIQHPSIYNWASIY